MTKKELEEKIELYERQINGLNNEIELYERQINGLNNEIEKMKIELSKTVEDEIPDFPKFCEGHIVWYMNDDFDVADYIKEVTSKTKNYNNFHMEEYAREYTEKNREIAMLLHCKWYIDRDYVPNWKDDDEVKYCVSYNHNEDNYVPDYFYGTEHLTVYFSTKQAAQKAADWMNKHCFIHKKDEI